MDNKTGRRDMYLGTLGSSHETDMHVAGKNGTLFCVKVFDRINADKDQHLLSQLIDGRLNKVLIPEVAEPVAIDIPILLHLPKRSMMLWVFSERTRHQILEQLSRFYESLRRETSQPIPRYVLQPKILIGAEKIPAFLADMDEAGAAASHRQKMADELASLERKREDLSRRETELKNAEANLSGEASEISSKQSELLIQNQKKETELLEREAELNRRLAELEKSRADHLAELKQEREALQQEVQQTKELLKTKTEEFEALKNKTESEVHQKLSSLAAKEQDTKAALSEEKSEFEKRRQAELEEFERQRRNELAALETQQAEFNDRVKELSSDLERKQAEIDRRAAEFEVEQAARSADLETRRRKLEEEAAEKREALEQERATNEQKLNERESLLATANDELEQQRQQQRQLEEQLAAQRAELEKQLAAMAAREAEKNEEYEKNQAALAAREAELQEKARIYENYESLSMLGRQPESPAPQRPIVAPVTTPPADDQLQDELLSPPPPPEELESGSIDGDLEDLDKLDEGWDFDIDEVDEDEAEVIYDSVDEEANLHSDVTEVLAFEELEEIEELEQDPRGKGPTTVNERPPTAGSEVKSEPQPDEELTPASAPELVPPPPPFPVQVSHDTVVEHISAVEPDEEDDDEPAMELDEAEAVIEVLNLETSGETKDEASGIEKQEGPSATRVAETDQLTATLHLENVPPCLVVRFKDKPAKKLKSPQLILQVHQLQSYGLVTLGLRDKAVNFDVILDVLVQADREFLTRLGKNFELEAEVFNHKGKSLQKTTLKELLEENARLALEDASGYTKNLGDSARDFAKAVELFNKPETDRNGKIAHPFQNDAFRDPSANNMGSPASVKTALGIITWWSNQQNFSYLALKKSHPIAHIRSLQTRILERAVYYGLWMEDEMKDRAVTLVIAESAPDLVQNCLANFAEVCLNIRNNDLTIEEIWENWQQLLRDCEDLQVTPDSQIEQLAKKAMRDFQRKSQSPSDSDEPIEVSESIEAEEYEDFSQLSAQELIDFLKYPEHRRDAAIALARMKDPGHLTELASVCELMDHDEIIGLFPDFAGYGKHAEETMLKLLSSRNPVITQAAALVLGQIRSDRATVPLLTELGSARNNQYMAFAWALGNLGPDIRKPASKAMKSKNIATRRMVDTLAYLISIHGADSAKKLRKDRHLKLMVATADDEYSDKKYRLPSSFAEKVDQLVQARGTVQHDLKKADGSGQGGGTSRDPDIFNVLEEL